MSLTRTLISVILGALAIVLLAVVGLGVRLWQGPIAIPALSQRIEDGLSALSPDLVAHVSRTELAWVEMLPELRVVDVAVSRRNGQAIAVVPELAIRLSLRALLHGEIAARAIAVFGVRASIVRDEDGAISLGTIDRGNEPQTAIDLGGLFGEGGGSAIEYLRRIVVGRSEVIFEDQKSGIVARVADTSVVLSRSGAVVYAVLGAAVSLTASKTPSFHGVSAKVGIEGQISYPREGGSPVIAATVRASDGKVIPGGDTGPPLPLRSLTGDVHFDSAADRVQLTALHAEIGSAVIEGSAAAAPTEAGWDLSGDGVIRSFAVAELRRFWPRTSAVAARRWIVDNIPEGTVSDGRYAIRLRSSPPPDSTEEPVDLRFRYQGLVVRYFGELDPARALQGTAHLTSHGFEARVSSGEVGGLKLTSGNVDIKFRTTPSRLTTSAEIAGPASAILEELAHPPLEIPAKVGIEPSAVGGTATARVDIEVPLHSGLASSEVRWTGRADVVDAAVRKLVGPVGIENGKLAVRVEGRRLEIEGDAVPTGVSGLASPAHLTVRYDPSEASQLAVAIDGADLKGEGTATIASQGLREVSVTKLQFGGNDLAGKVTSRTDGGYHLAIQGETVDLEPLLRGDKTGGDLAQSLSRPFDGEFRIKKVLLGSGLQVLDVIGTGAGAGARVEQLAVKATLGGTPIDVDLVRQRAGRRLRVRSQNAGAVLRAAGAPTEVQGGNLTFIARFPNEAGKDTSGVLSMRDIRVVRAPTLARILAAGSLTGIEDLLKGEGLTFERARVPYRWKAGRIEIVDARAVGSMGFTADGTIDRSARTIDVHGHVIPAYTLNAALGKIPYLGDFLVGGKGEGVFGIEYRVSGSVDQPDVNVNALSALAPGALRRLFVDPFTRSDEDAQGESDR